MPDMLPAAADVTIDNRPERRRPVRKGRVEREADPARADRPERRLNDTPANLLFPLFVTGQLAGALLGRAIAPSKLTSNEFAVLSLVAVFEPISPTELAQRAGMPATTLSDYVTRLVTRRFLKRAPNPDDGRSYLLSLTAEGRRRNALAITGLLESNRVIAANLAVEPATVRAALVELEHALRTATRTTS
jgi:DNA-binding MarR family transcriptional regulator